MSDYTPTVNRDTALIDFDPTWLLPEGSVVVLPSGEAAILCIHSGHNAKRGDSYWRTTGSTWLSDLSSHLPARVVYNPLKYKAEEDGYKIDVLSTVEDAIKAWKGRNNANEN